MLLSLWFVFSSNPYRVVISDLVVVKWVPPCWAGGHRQVGNATHPALYYRYQSICSRISTGSLSKWAAGSVMHLGGSCSVISAR